MKHFDLEQNQLVEDERVDAFVSQLKTFFRQQQLVLRFDPARGRPVIEAWEAGAADYLDDALLGPGASPSFLPKPRARRTPES